MTTGTAFPAPCVCGHSASRSLRPSLGCRRRGSSCTARRTGRRISGTSRMPTPRLASHRPSNSCAARTRDESGFPEQRDRLFPPRRIPQVVVVAPVMTDLNAPGGVDDYRKQPKGNLDVTGQYFIWTSNVGGSRLDAFIVKVPTRLLAAPGPPQGPDLVTTAVSNPPAAAAPGSAFSVTDTVKNEGNARAAASTSRYYLSLDATKGTGDIRLDRVGPRPVSRRGCRSRGRRSRSRSRPPLPEHVLPAGLRR